MTEYKDISLHVKNRVDRVDFNRRPPVNAKDWDMVQEIHAAVRSIKPTRL